VAFLRGWADESRGAPLTFTDEEIPGQGHHVRQAAIREDHHPDLAAGRRLRSCWASQQVDRYIRVGLKGDLAAVDGDRLTAAFRSGQHECGGGVVRGYRHGVAVPFEPEVHGVPVGRVLKQAKKGGKFEDLAKKYSEDPGTKDKGGDLGWIVQKQTVPEFEKTAFSLNPGQISDLVKTQYGFHIIKVMEKEMAHTKPFEEVKESLRAPLVLSQADKLASDTADQLSAAIRQSNKVSLDDLAKQYHLISGETRPITATDPLLELGNSQDVKDAIFRLRPGELSLPVRTDRGYVVLSLKEAQPAHQGSVEEVRDRVITDLKRGKSTELAKNKAEELARRVKAGEKFDSAAKALGLEPKTSDSIARDGSIAGGASGKQLGAAFNLKAGDVGTPLNLGQNWFVYRVAEKVEPNPVDFETQKKQLLEEALQAKRNLAFEAFRSALGDRLKQEGKLKLMPEKLKNFGSLG